MRARGARSIVGPRRMNSSIAWSIYFLFAIQLLVNNRIGCLWFKIVNERNSRMKQFAGILEDMEAKFLHLLEPG